MRKSAILITGANGEIGHGLITYFNKLNIHNIITLDLVPLASHIKKLVNTEIIGNILDKQILQKLNSEYNFHSIYHLAALLSSKSEIDPLLANNINTQGTLNLLQFASEHNNGNNKLKFFFPSSIAVYGLNSLKEKEQAGAVREEQFLNPLTIYGCNKLYCEYLGNYYKNKYQIDFRAIRFPGIISSQTLPTGGTSDYFSEMLHSAAQGKKYICFVNGASKIPFMTMPDAVQAICMLMDAEITTLNRIIYNIRSFSPYTKEVIKKIILLFPNAKIDYKINYSRQNMINSWPSDTSDINARQEWNWRPQHNFNTAFSDYLLPDLKKLYSI